MPDIYIYDSNQWGGFGFLNDFSIEVFSVADMVTKVLKATEKAGGEINISLAGLCTTNYQSVGAKGTADISGDRSFQLDADGNLKGGGGRYLWLLANKITSVRLNGLAGTPGNGIPLMMAMGKSLGFGVSFHTTNTSLKYYGQQQLVRQPTSEATLDRDALKTRLAGYTSQ